MSNTPKVKKLNELYLSREKKERERDTVQQLELFLNSASNFQKLAINPLSKIASFEESFSINIYEHFM